ncbi:SRPBCC family protein [Bacteroides sp. 519]|uniref:SRPBCC family protein n=1 Tax=Bacteroides sp. 519 TaxID=2302937 RepID=UPI0013D4169B|nr:SRPBCC family protein [Bacteroides sp. 519]NDV59294.1 SRPBCC family protein [Bacteroides sp. 519]
MSKFESGIKEIPYSQERVYNKLSNLSHLEGIKDKIPQDKIQDLEFDTDTISFSMSPVGKVTLNIVERDPVKCIKFGTTTSPLPFTLWIQILPVTEETSKMKITVETDLNPMMKMMVEKPLKEGLEKMASMIATIPY